MGKALPHLAQSARLWNSGPAQEISGHGLTVPTWIPRLGAAERSMRDPGKEQGSGIY
jgi:hypothetical protein